MAKDKHKARRDAAGVGPDPSTARRRLIPIDDMKGYRLAAGDPDIRGWDVRTLGGRELGEVEDLLVDPDRGEVVMLEVDMRGEAGVHAEVPIRSVQLDRKHHVVLVDSGDLFTRNDVRARDRIDPTERDRFRAEPGTQRDVRLTAPDDTVDRGNDVEEVVLERRPVVEEVVVRRRVVESDD